MKYNMTIDSASKVVKIDHLKSDLTTVTGTDYISYKRLRDEKDGWWFDRTKEAEYNQKYLYADIVNLNGSPITAEQDEVTALLLDITDRLPDGTVVTKDGKLIVSTLDDSMILTIYGFEEA